MTTVAIDNNNNIQIFKNKNLIKSNDRKTSVFDNKTSTYDIYNLFLINNVKIRNESSNTILNNISTQLGDLSVVIKDDTLAVIINNMLTQLTTLEPPAVPTDSISSGSISFNDNNLTINRITGNLSWIIPGDLTDITHFEGFLSVDRTGLRRELNSLFIVDNTIDNIDLTDVFIGSNLYIVIYTKNVNSVGISSLQTTLPGYILINDVYGVDILSATFVPFNSLFDRISGTISWSFNIEDEKLFDGVNLYFSFNGVSKGAMIELDIIKTTTYKIITNETFDRTQPYYVQIYTYKEINSIKYESPIYKTIKIDNKYQPTNLVSTSLDFMGDMDTVSGTLTGTLIWEFELPKESVNGVDIFITDTGTVFGETDNLVGRTTNCAISSFTFKSLNIMIENPADRPNTVKANKFIVRSYNQYGNNPVTVAEIVFDL